MKKEFNGYRSWNGWNIALWINNDYGLYSHARSVVEKYGYKKGLNILAKEWEGMRTPDGGVFNRISIKNAIVDIV